MRPDMSLHEKVCTVAPKSKWESADVVNSTFWSAVGANSLMVMVLGWTDPRDWVRVVTVGIQSNKIQCAWLMADWSLSGQMTSSAARTRKHADRLLIYEENPNSEAFNKSCAKTGTHSPTFRNLVR